MFLPNRAAIATKPKQLDTTAARRPHDIDRQSSTAASLIEGRAGGAADLRWRKSSRPKRIDHGEPMALMKAAGWPGALRSTCAGEVVAKAGRPNVESVGRSFVRAGADDGRTDAGGGSVGSRSGRSAGRLRRRAQMMDAGTDLRWRKSRPYRPSRTGQRVDIMHLMRNSKGRIRRDLWGFPVPPCILRLARRSSPRATRLRAAASLAPAQVAVGRSAVLAVGLRRRHLRQRKSRSVGCSASRARSVGRPTRAPPACVPRRHLRQRKSRSVGQRCLLSVCGGVTCASASRGRSAVGSCAGVTVADLSKPDRRPDLSKLGRGRRRRKLADPRAWTASQRAFDGLGEVAPVGAQVAVGRLSAVARA
jgi:hypothetical protein